MSSATTPRHKTQLSFYKWELWCVSSRSSLFLTLTTHYKTQRAAGHCCTQAECPHQNLVDVTGAISSNLPLSLNVDVTSAGWLFDRDWRIQCVSESIPQAPFNITLCLFRCLSKYSRLRVCVCVCVSVEREMVAAFTLSSEGPEAEVNKPDVYTLHITDADWCCTHKFWDPEAPISHRPMTSLSERSVCSSTDM